MFNNRLYNFQMQMPMVKYIDCDNTLVQPKNLAFEACADLANELLEKHGQPERYTAEFLLEDFVWQSFRGMLSGL
ncbi:hypothetical protein MMC21_008472 [Puttea exsequens]|nr:hypothetical protein [Puttea exsequens]